MSKQQIILDEKNFTRLKKTLLKNLKKENIEISSTKLAELLSHSMGFSNYHQAKKEDFKTDKFKNKIVYQRLERHFFVSMKDFFYNQRELFRLFYCNNKKIDSSDTLKVLNEIYYGASKKIMSNIKNHLETEEKTGLKFDLAEWLEYFKKFDLSNYCTILLDCKEKGQTQEEIRLMKKFLSLRDAFNLLIWNITDPYNRLNIDTILLFQKKLLNYVLKVNEPEYDILYLSTFCRSYNEDKPTFALLSPLFDLFAKTTNEEQFKRCFDYILMEYPFYYKTNKSMKHIPILKLIFEKETICSWNSIDLDNDEFINKMIFRFKNNDEQFVTMLNLLEKQKLNVPTKFKTWENIIKNNENSSFEEKYTIFRSKMELLLV